MARTWTLRIQLRIAALAHNVTRIPAVAVLSLERLLCNGGSAEALQCVTYCTQNQPASCVGN